MTNPTSNFGWQMPTSTDLVTDLPADFETFGQAVDTSLADLKGGTTGQVLSKASNTDMDFTWVAQDDSNAIQNAIVDAKGDLIAASAADTPARLAVGNNGETLVADSSTATGLRYQGNFAAGKNKIINGDFSVNQRNFSSSTGDGYGFDRWSVGLSGGTATYSLQTFALGTAPVAGYEGKNFARFAATTGNDFLRLLQPIESVRTFAGQTMTLSFWAKGTNPTTAGNLKATVVQSFGTGGSPSATVFEEKTFVLTANWTRYSLTFNVASIAGKTIGTNNDDALQIWFGQGTNTSTESWTLDLWGVQAEAGSVATAFQTATGTIQGELAACQRYYFRNTPGTAYGLQVYGASYATNTVLAGVIPPVTMRVTPTSVDVSNLQVFDVVANASYSISSLVFASAVNGPMNIGIEATASGATAGRPMFIRNNNNTAGYLGFSAEL